MFTPPDSVDTRSSAYPRPRVPILPPLSAAAFAWGERGDMPCLLDAGSAIEVRSGSAAITLALRHAGISSDETVLLPAFHCPSMVQAVLAAPAVPAYYRIRENLSVDLNDLQGRLGRSVRALLVPHYFGFPQPIVEVRDFCEAHRLVLIEDCAHAFFGEYEGRALGSFGDYAIASVRKFFPVYDGGYLISASRSLRALRLQGAGLAYNLKIASNLLEEAIGFGRLQRASLLLTLPLQAKDRLWETLKATRHAISQVAQAPDENAGSQCHGWPGGERCMSVVTRWVVRSASVPRLVRLRRANFARLSTALSAVRGGHPLFGALPVNVVPYMFPFIIDEPSRHFHRLKKAGVPIWRWDDGDTADCSVSHSYARHLLQLPCHQELRDEELDWMVATIEKKLRAPSRRHVLAKRGSSRKRA